MVPLEIELQNFLSYRSEEIDFCGVHVACIAGENGHGKSAIIDAMTWALYGEARKSSGSRKPDGDIVNRVALREDGATEMAVRFQFRAGEDTYEINRSYRESASGKTTTGNLEFFYLGDERKDRTAGKMKETQKRIREVVPVGHETLKNTSFMLQGESDAFTQKRPAERKEVLTSVLQLGQYERYRETVREEESELESAAERARGQIEQLNEQLEGANERKDELKEIRNRAKKLEKAIDSDARQIDDFEEKIQEAREKQQRLNSLRERKEELEEERASVDGQIEDLKEEISELTQLTENAGKIRQEAEKLEELREEKRRLADLQEKQSKLGSEAQEAEHALEQAKQARDAERREEAARANRKRNTLQGIAGGEHQDDEDLVEDAISVAEHQIEGVKERRARKESLQSKAEDLSSRIEKTSDSLSGRKSDRSGWESELEHFKSQRSDLGDLEGGGKCPCCGQVVPAEHLESVREELAVKIDDLKAKIEVAETEIHQLSEKLSANKAERSEVTSEIAELDTGGLENARLAKSTAEDAAEELREAKARIEKLSESWTTEKGQSVEELREEAEEARETAESFGFDAERYEEVKSRAEELEGALDRLSRLEQAETKLEAKRDRLEELQKRWGELDRKAKAQEADIQDVSPRGELDPEKKIVETKQVLSETKTHRENLQEELSEVQARSVQLESKIEADEKAREEIGELEDIISETEERLQLTGHLKDAFSKHGIPSLVIESVLPTIEAKANDILARLTGGEMSLRLETTREKKTGGTADTLEVVVEDRSGSDRPYETFSGGEGFRIDFALRVALSEVLASKSGASIDVLVIDEGFGTQDDEGLQAIQDAVSTAASEFELILVVTHLDALKDSFPQRLQVRKPAGRGSQARLIE